MVAKSFTTISSEQTHWSCRGKSHVRAFTPDLYLVYILGVKRGVGCYGIGGWVWWVWCCGTTVLVCFSIRGSGTVDVQRLAVLLWSMEHAEAHTFIHSGVGVATRTHTCWEKKRHDRRSLHVHWDHHAMKTLHLTCLLIQHRIVLTTKVNIWLCILTGTYWDQLMFVVFRRTKGLQTHFD